MGGARRREVGGQQMPYKIENIKTETWHKIIDDLLASGFIETYQYDGIDAGIDYNRCDLTNQAGDELIIFEWDNWMEGEIKATRSRLEVIRERYQLSELVDVEK